MLKMLLAAGVLAGGLMAVPGNSGTTIAAPIGLNAAGAHQSGVTQVRRGFHGFRGHFGGHHFGGRHFGGRHFYGGGRHFAYRGWGHRRWGHRGWRGGRYFLYGALPLAGYGAYYGYGYSDCAWLRHRYYVTGSRYWYRRWAQCRGWW